MVACGDSDLVCITTARSTVGTIVKDAGTGDSIEGALVVVREGTFADSARARADRTLDEPSLVRTGPLSMPSRSGRAA